MSDRVSAEQGAADGAAAATAIALVFAMRMRPAFLGAATLAGAGHQGWAGNNEFFAAMTARANGYDWEELGKSRGQEDVAETRREYLSQFQAALEAGLDAPRDAGRMIRDLAAGADGTSGPPTGDDPVFRWIRELVALQARNLDDEEQLQATRRREVEQQVFPAWLLPPVRDGSRLERWTVSRDFPMRFEKEGPAFQASVSNRKTGRVILRAEFMTKAEAETAAWEFALLRSVIANRREYRSLNETVSRIEQTSEPFGGDGAARLRRLADRSDRLRRGGGVGDFTDDQAWQAVLDGDANHFLARFAKPPFRGSLGPF
jgi:hypothetical protein